MEQGIGELLYRLREEAGISQGQLCKGVCSVSQLTRMEQNLLAPDPFQLDYLFRRMGKSTELLEYVLSVEMYEIYELQYLIQTHICRQNWEEAESLLSQYEEKKQAKKPIHMQYILQERAQIAWIRGEGVKEILPVLNQAIIQTMPLEGAVKSGMALGADELRLILFRWEVCKGTVYERKDEEIREILNYIYHKKMENAELVRVYPYVVLLMRMIFDWKKEKNRLLTLTREALSILRDEGRLLFMPEILGQYGNLLESVSGDAELIADLKTERESLLAVEEEFQIHLEKYRLFQQWIRSFELDCELVQNARRASGIVQEDLCEGICSQETLSRIETAKRSPNNRNLSQLLKRMERERKRIGTILTTDEYEVLELKRKLSGELQRFEYEKAEEILEKIERKLDLSNPANRQYIAAEKIRMDYEKKRIDGQTSIEKLEEVLRITLPLNENKDIPYKYTITENNIWNQIAAIYYECDEKEKAIEILNMQIKSLEESRVECIFRIREWGLALGNLATALEETHRLKEAMETCKKRMRVSIEAGKGNGIGRNLVILAFAMEQIKDGRCRKYYLQGASLLKLYKMYKRYDIIKTYLDSPEFQFKE